MNPSGIGTSAVKLLARIFVWALAAVAIIWGILLLPFFWQEAAPNAVAAKLLQGQTFKLQSLFDQAHQAEKVAKYFDCTPSALHSLFVLRLFILNASIEAPNHELENLAYPPLYDAAVKSLSCAPADPFVWLTLFWIDARTHGIDDKNANYLRLSYALGANEAWISLWRVRLAFLAFERLPPDLADDAVNEFVRLVNSERENSEMADIFEAVAPAVQHRIVDRLGDATLRSRVAFAGTLHKRDLNIDIPGVEKPEARPWR